MTNLTNRIRESITASGIALVVAGLLAASCNNNNNSQNSCAKDTDCAGDQVCEYNVCADVIDVSPRTAQQTWEGLYTALHSNDLNQVLKYFTKGRKESCTQLLEGRDLPSIADSMPSLPLQPTFQRGNLSQYEIITDTCRYGVKMYCPHDHCMLI